MGNNLITDGGNVDVYFTKYKSYIAILSQPNQDDNFANPIAKILNGNDSNFLGDIEWTSTVDEGTYKGTLTGAFTPDKVYINTTINYINTPITNVLPAEGTVNEVYFTTFLDKTVIPFLGNGIFIEIRVY